MYATASDFCGSMERATATITLGIVDIDRYVLIKKPCSATRQSEATNGTFKTLTPIQIRK